MSQKTHLSIGSEIMLKSLFMALRYNVNHHPEEEESKIDNFSFKIYEYERRLGPPGENALHVLTLGHLVLTRASANFQLVMHVQLAWSH